MSDHAPATSSKRPPRQPKLRTSCDACGATKVKCDRGKPDCGRCVSHGLKCVYGVSQKMGKPPRNRIGQGQNGQCPAQQGAQRSDSVTSAPSNNKSNMINTFHHTAPQALHLRRPSSPPLGSATDHHVTGTASNSAAAAAAAAIPTPTSLTSAWQLPSDEDDMLARNFSSSSSSSIMDNDVDTFMGGAGGLDNFSSFLYADPFALSPSSSQPDFASGGYFGEWPPAATADFKPMPPQQQQQQQQPHHHNHSHSLSHSHHNSLSSSTTDMGAAHSSSFSASTTSTSTPSLPHLTPSSSVSSLAQAYGVPPYHFAAASGKPASAPNTSAGAAQQQHACFREAYEVMGSLSCLELPSSPSSQASPSAKASQMPLDDVLRLNREAGERLSRLLACPCARTPHLAMVHASIISRILTWYQQAAGLSRQQQQQQQQQAPPAFGATSWNTSSPVSPASAYSPLSGGMGGVMGHGVAPPPAPSQFFVAPSDMAIGSFQVDDPRIQATLKMQLLSSEMERTGRLIDRFAACASGGAAMGGLGADDASALGTSDNLFPPLESWLRNEHSRVDGMMRAKLRELSI